METVRGRVSTKWVYTHLKADAERLPRIDVLNLLSRYVGAESWESFVALQEDVASTETVAKAPQPASGSKRTKPIVLGAAIIALVFLGGLLVYGMLPEPTPKAYTLCLVDADLGFPLADAELNVTLLHEDESVQVLPILEADENGCFSMETARKSITLVIETSYYHTDTVVRTLTAGQASEIIRLKSDDFALLIDHLSRFDIEDWERRRKQLDEMFASEARIFQVNPGTERGMEMYNKEEFIDKLTVPVNSLRNIRVLETQYDKGRIVGLRFVQEDE